MPSITLALPELPWLIRTDPEFRARLKALESVPPENGGRKLQALAGQFLGLNQAIVLAKTFDRMRARAPVGGLSPFRLGLVSHATVDFLKPFLVVSGLRHGLALEIVAADFGQLVQEAMNPHSRINQARPDAVLLALDHRGLPFRRPGRSMWPLFDAGAAGDDIETAATGFRRNCGATSVIQTLPAPLEMLLGSLDAATPGTLRAEIAMLNARLLRGAAERADIVVDIEWLAQAVGLETWYDDRDWHSARAICSQRVLPIYAEFVVRSLAAVRGKSRKCLILDLDNTVWGGVVGDDGMDGIAISPGDGRGEAYRTLQQSILDLRSRGVVLAVCSKNDEATARQPFREHPDMLLRESDIALFVANWNDKASNIERIAAHLELGLDAMVFLDDNPAERAQVRAALPEVAVPELSDDPSTYARLLSFAGYFESSGFTTEDLARADQYRRNAERAQVLAGSRNLDEFLQSLDMEIDFAPFTAQGRKRITQLINKTNQFNVTTRRYSEQEVEALESAADQFTLQVSTRDRFGDNGMIGVVICRIAGDEWEIDTWLMSCRVLNRGVEQAVCNYLVATAAERGAKRLTGRYLATERNGIVRDLYARLGFVPSPSSGPADRWLLELDSFVPLQAFFRRRTG